MKKAWHLSAFALVLVLLVVTAYLALAPTPALAAFGSARCSDGSIVICNAFRCVCQDMQGCTAYNSAGGVMPGESRYCPGVAGPGY